MNILLIGQCTLHWGRMEFGNIGNYYIIEPFVRELHRVFPNATIKTTFQMSEEFCIREKITVLPMDYYYGWTGNDLDVALKEIEIAEKYAITGMFEEVTPYIEAVMDADLIIDYSGDIWGDNANLLGRDRFLVGLYKDLVAQKLSKTIVMLAGSPGPFSDNESKKIAKEVFKGFDLVTNREPISKDILNKNGFDVEHVQSLACPSFLFEPSKDSYVNTLLNNEKILGSCEPIVGFVLCGWNFTQGPFDKWPRDDEEYTVFAEAIEFISESIGAKVYLMSHSNGFPIPPKEFKLIHGRDYPIIKQLQRIINDRGIAKNVFALDEAYDAWTTKAIIGHFDMLVGGRVHSTVASTSQCVPTVIIDYGHEPKAHKLRGFAKVISMDNYVANPSKKHDLINKIDQCWNDRVIIRRILEEKIPLVKKMASQNFDLLPGLIK
ncbi:hypothetical protein EO92_06065 [Methanosarcina sp. 2.H.A.1B.4]|nr:hypothetical protein EO92_06065 [Methanosarcina sp. 2.H.A.1B.4]